MAVRAAFGDFQVLSHSDIKPAANVLLAHHYPDIPNLGDMRAIDYSQLPPADLMIGSWPCGPHSAAGRRLGEADPRDLWPEYLRAIDATRPAIFFGENVARIASNGELRRVVTSLAERGYVGAWRSVRASDVGACHRRDRMFVVAVDPAANTASSGLPAWSSKEQGPGESPSTRRGRPANSSQSTLSLLPTPNATLVGSRMDTRCSGDGRSTPNKLGWAISNLLPTPKASDGEKGGPGMRGRKGDLFLPSAVQAINFGQYAGAVARHEQALGRPAPEPTQPSVRTGNPQLSARFVEWMQMLPDGWVTDVPGLVDSPRKSERNAQLSLLGDGVVPAQGAAAFRFLLGHLSQRFPAEVAA